MIHIDKVKLMDSGTVLFRAESREAAVAKVVRALKGAELEEYAPDAFLADFSDAFFYSVVRAVVEPMSEEGRFAASFQEAHGPDQGRRRRGVTKNCLDSKNNSYICSPDSTKSVQATLAQSVEQRIRNAQVASSSLVSGSKKGRATRSPLF